MSIFTIPPRQNIKRGCKASLPRMFLALSSLLLVTVGWARFGAMDSVPEHPPMARAWGGINRTQSRIKTLQRRKASTRELLQLRASHASCLGRVSLPRGLGDVA